MEIYIKQNVSQEEYNMYLYVYDLNIVNIPIPIDYDPDNHIMTTQRIDAMNISDLYGEYAHQVPTIIWDEIVNTVRTLLEHGIQYPDITGYNFIWHRDTLWIVDFEHAFRLNNPDDCIDELIDKFCQWEIGDPKEWNPEFR